MKAWPSELKSKHLHIAYIIIDALIDKPRFREPVTYKPVKPFAQFDDMDTEVFRIGVNHNTLSIFDIRFRVFLRNGNKRIPLVGILPPPDSGIKPINF